MSFLINCGVCCMALSIWAILQLVLMGIFFKMEAVVFIEEAEAHDYTDYDDFIKKTKANYSILAVNCWIAAAIYAVMVAISYGCVRHGRKQEKERLALLEDDVRSCKPAKPKPTKKQKYN